IFVFTFSGNEPLGTYVLFTLLTPPGAFADGRVDAGDILVLDAKPFTTTPTMPPTTSTTPPVVCCKICTTGKACGDTCISATETCHVGPGCACDNTSPPTSTIPSTSTVPSTTTSSTTTSTIPPTTSTTPVTSSTTSTIPPTSTVPSTTTSS